jgi:hypothetical protein
LRGKLLKIIQSYHSRIEYLEIIKWWKPTPFTLCTNFTTPSAIMLSFLYLNLD